MTSPDTQHLSDDPPTTEKVVRDGKIDEYDGHEQLVVIDPDFGVTA